MKQLELFPETWGPQLELFPMNMAMCDRAHEIIKLWGQDIAQQLSAKRYMK